MIEAGALNSTVYLDAEDAQQEIYKLRVQRYTIMKEFNFIAALRSAKSQSTVCCIEHFPRQRIEKQPILSPWKRSDYYYALLSSVLHKLSLKLYFCALGAYAMMMRGRRQLIAERASHRDACAVRNAFAVLKNHYVESKQLIDASCHVAQEYYINRQLLCAIKCWCAFTAMQTQQHSLENCAQRIFIRSKLMNGLAALKVFAKSRLTISQRNDHMQTYSYTKSCTRALRILHHHAERRKYFRYITSCFDERILKRHFEHFISALRRPSAVADDTEKEVRMIDAATSPMSEEPVSLDMTEPTSLLCTPSVHSMIDLTLQPLHDMASCPITNQDGSPVSTTHSSEHHREVSESVNHSKTSLLLHQQSSRSSGLDMSSPAYSDAMERQSSLNTDCDLFPLSPRVLSPIQSSYSVCSDPIEQQPFENATTVSLEHEPPAPQRCVSPSLSRSLHRQLLEYLAAVLCRIATFCQMRAALRVWKLKVRVKNCYAGANIYLQMSKYHVLHRVVSTALSLRSAKRRLYESRYLLLSAVLREWCNVVLVLKYERYSEWMTMRADAFRSGTLLATYFVAWANCIDEYKKQKCIILESRLKSQADVFNIWKRDMYQTKARDDARIRRFRLKLCRRILIKWCDYILSEHYTAPLKYALRLRWNKWEKARRFHIVYMRRCAQLHHQAEICFKIWWNKTLHRLAIRHVAFLLQRVTERVRLREYFFRWPGRMLSRRASELALRLIRRPRRIELIGSKPWSIAARNAFSMKGMSAWSEARHQLRAIALQMSDGFVRCKEAVRGLLVAVLRSWRTVTIKYRRINRYGLLLRACVQLRIKSGIFYKWLVHCPTLSRRLLWISSNNGSHQQFELPYKITLDTYFELNNASMCDK